MKVLNQNAVIVMSVTGESYIDCAKSALAIIFENLGLFYIVDFIGDMVVFFGILSAVGIPTVIGFLIVRYGHKQTDTADITFTCVSIFFMSLMLSSIIIPMISEALSCIFIFFCFDRKF